MMKGRETFYGHHTVAMTTFPIAHIVLAPTVRLPVNDDIIMAKGVLLSFGNFGIDCVDCGTGV